VNVTVTNPAPGGGTSTAAPFAINNATPVLSSLAPTSTIAGSVAFTLTVNGTGFVNGAVVNFNGAARVTTFVSGVQITAAITAADVATVGSIPVTVTNPAPTAGPSAALTFTVNNPVPTVTTLGNTHAPGGTAFTLTVNGTNFVAGSVVNFNGKAEVTTFVSATQVTAAIPMGDVSTGGTVPVTVTNPAPGGGTTASTNFTIDDYALSVPTSTATVIAGQPAMYTITATPGTNGFAGAITFSAAVVGGGALPKGVGVAFVPATITPNAAPTSTMLTISTTARSLVPVPPARRPSPQAPVTYKLFGVLSAALAMAIFAASQLKTRQWRTAALIPALVIVLGVLVMGGCSSEFAQNPVGTPAGTTQIQVTASSGTLSHMTTVTLTVQ
jgi:hypothetical protein